MRLANAGCVHLTLNVYAPFLEGGFYFFLTCKRVMVCRRNAYLHCPSKPDFFDHFVPRGILWQFVRQMANFIADSLGGGSHNHVPVIVSESDFLMSKFALQIVKQIQRLLGRQVFDIEVAQLGDYGVLRSKQAQLWRLRFGCAECLVM